MENKGITERNHIALVNKGKGLAMSIGALILFSVCLCYLIFFAEKFSLLLTVIFAFFCVFYVVLIIMFLAEGLLFKKNGDIVFLHFINNKKFRSGELERIIITVYGLSDGKYDVKLLFRLKNGSEYEPFGGKTTERVAQNRLSFAITKEQKEEMIKTLSAYGICEIRTEDNIKTKGFTGINNSFLS